MGTSIRRDRIVGRTYREAARACEAVREALRAFAELGTALMGARASGERPSTRRSSTRRASGERPSTRRSSTPARQRPYRVPSGPWPPVPAARARPSDGMRMLPAISAPSPSGAAAGGNDRARLRQSCLPRPAALGPSIARTSSRGADRSCTVLTRWARLRPRRSSFQTTSTSSFRSAHRQLSSPGRSSQTPEARSW